MATTAAETPVLDTLTAMTAESIARSGLEPAQLLTARIGALAAVQAPPASYLMHIGPAIDAGVTLEDVQHTLVAVAPIIGTSRTLEAAMNITEALGVAVTALAAEIEAGLDGDGASADA